MFAARIVTELRSWWKAIRHPDQAAHEAASELEYHIEAYAADLERQGVPATEAARRARVAVGQPTVQGEKYREAIGLGPLDELSGDIRYALRSLLKNPGFSAVAILSLALGIGATTSMFSLIYAVLIHPYPYAGADRIMNPVLIDESQPELYRWFALSKSQFQTLSHAKALESLLSFRNVDMEMTGGAFPEDIDAVYLTENTSSFFGVPPLLGRDIQPSDAADKSGHPSNQIVVLNYRFWQSHYNGDPGVLGRTLQLDHKNFTIVGVMPRAFAFSNMTGTGDIYLPRSLLRDTASPPVHWPWTPLIKLKAGISADQADAELQTVVEQFARENPEHYPKRFRLRLQPIAAPFAEKSGRTLSLLFAAVVMLLIIGCANCSILLLARGAARQHELAVRSAIGASRWRIVRQLLVESAMLVVAGSVAGAALAWFLAKLPLQLSPASFPPETVIRVNQPVLGFAVALAVVVSLLTGLAPALRLSRPDVSQMAQKTSQRTNTRRGKSSYQFLIAGQIALTLVLMAVAGAAATAFLKLTRTSLGYDPHHVMQAGIVMHWTDPQDWERIRSREARAAFIEQIRQKIAAIPGVLSISASVGTNATPPSSGPGQAFEISGKPSSADAADPDRIADVIRVSPEYFSTLRIPLLAGRVWDATENRRGDSVAVINRAMAQRDWPGGNSLGQQIRIPSLKSTAPLVSASPGSADWRQVIGIVGDARNNGVGSPVEAAIYLPYSTLMEPFAQFLIRTQGEPLALLRQVRIAVESVSTDQQVNNGTVDLEQALSLDPEWSRERLFSVLFGIFSMLALALALVGLYSVVSYSVAQRTNEFGIRMALGAQRGHVLWIVARGVGITVASGLAAGLAVTLATQKLVAQWTQDNPASHGLATQTPIILAAVALLFLVSAAAACIFPALRAASVDPVTALRYE